MGTTDQLAGVVTGWEPELEVDPRLAAPGFFFGEVAEAHQPLVIRN